MTTTLTLKGRTAIRYAEANGLPLHKYADPTEDAREGLTVAEAREVAREDPNLIWLDVEPLRYEVREIGDRQVLGGLLFTTDDAAQAKTRAKSLGSEHYYGVAIVDRAGGTVDFGTLDGVPWVEPLAHVHEAL